MKKKPKATKKAEFTADLLRWAPVCVWLKGGLSFADWRALSFDDKNAVIEFCNKMAGDGVQR